MDAAKEDKTLASNLEANEIKIEDDEEEDEAPYQSSIEET